MLVEWLLQRGALTEALARSGQVDARQRDLGKRAREAFDLADVEFYRVDFRRADAPVGLIAEMYRQAEYFAHAARAAKSEPVAARAELAEARRLALSETGFVELSRLSSGEQMQLLHELRNLAERDLELLEAPLVALERLRARRAARVALVAVVFVALALSVLGVVRKLTRTPDLAALAAWHTSSTYATCHPDVPECGGAASRIFFHTNEQREPWFEYDFSRPIRFSSITVENRRDCCGERALPLIAEVSDDNETFREIARIDGAFKRWEPHFAQQTARFLRLRVPRRTQLHLEAVEVHP